MNHEESKLQQECVAWFRTQYPQYAMLLIHPINEGSGHSQTDRRRQGIHKAEGAVAGVPDLLLFMPGVEATYNDLGIQNGTIIYHALGIELKTAKGKQSQEQKNFEKMFTAAQYKYVVMRSFDEFKKYIKEWIDTVNPLLRTRISAAHLEVVQAQEQREKEHFYKVIGKKEQNLI